MSTLQGLSEKMRLENKAISLPFINTKSVERFISWLINNLKLFLDLPNVFLLSIKRMQMACCAKNVSGKKQTVIQTHFSKKESTIAINNLNSQLVDNGKIIQLIN